MDLRSTKTSSRKTHTHLRIKDIRRSGPDARLPFYNRTLGSKNTLVHAEKICVRINDISYT